jgi:hypothetical protein
MTLARAHVCGSLARHRRDGVRLRVGQQQSHRRSGSSGDGLRGVRIAAIEDNLSMIIIIIAGTVWPYLEPMVEVQSTR